MGLHIIFVYQLFRYFLLLLLLLLLRLHALLFSPLDMVFVAFKRAFYGTVLCWPFTLANGRVFFFCRIIASVGVIGCILSSLSKQARYHMKSLYEWRSQVEQRSWRNYEHDSGLATIKKNSVSSQWICN